MRVFFETLAFLILSLVVASAASGDGPDGTATATGKIDPASAQAMLQTQDMLRDPQERAKAVAISPQAGFVDKSVQNLAGTPENTNSIYDLSSDILDSLVSKTGGDPGKMMELLNQAKNDPKSFYEQLSPDEKKKLHDIAARIPAGTNQIPVTPPTTQGH